MSLLYFHSPMPPAESGNADYAFEIDEAIARTAAESAGSHRS
jgi:hypothetical protein